MNKSWWFIGIAGMLCFASGCSTKTVSQASNSNSVTTPTASPPTEAAKLPDKSFFPSPLVSASSTIRPVPVPNLIPPTASVARVPQVQAGRSDPFASLGYTPTVVKLKQSDNASLPSSIATVPLSKPSLPPIPQTISLPQPAIPQPLPVPPPPATSLPSQNVPVQSSAETIEISGVLQVGGKTNVIIKDPNEQTSRSVAVGERLANGKVLVKRVQMGLEPVVILEQGGREIVRSVGASGALIGAL